MAAFNFPNSPSVNDLHTENGATFKWNGTMWLRVGSAYTDTTNLNVTGIGTFAGNVFVNGVLTYEDVKNVDSVGIITARDDIKLTKAEGQIEATGATGLTLNASHGSAYARIRTAGSERLRIDSNGNFGFGDTGPANFTGYTNLSIHGSTGGAITFGDDGTDEWEIYGGDGVLKVYDRANTSERLRIDSGGRLLIGYSSSQSVYSTSALQVQGTNAATSSVSLLRHNGSPYLSLGATGGSSLGGVAAVSSGDRLGQLTFVGADGTDVNTHACSIAGYVDGSVSGNTVPGRLVFKCSTGAGEPERMRITSTGKIGINETNPDEILHINSGTSNGCLKLESTDSQADLYIADNSGQVAISANGDNLLFQTTSSQTERVRIDAVGMMGVRTQVPRATLHLKAHDNNWEGGLLIENNTNSNGWNIHPESSDNTLMIGYNDDVTTSLANQTATNIFRITSSGLVGINCNPSTNHTFHVKPAAGGSDAWVMVQGGTNQGFQAKKTDGTLIGYYGNGGGVGYGVNDNAVSAPAGNLILQTGGTATGNERMRITSAGKVEIGSGGTYGSSPQTLNLGSRANNVAGSLAIARGEALGGGTGPYMELVHGPDGGTQRIHSIYSYVGDLRIVADSNENMELHTGGSSTVKITSAKNIGINCTDPDSALEIRSTAGSYTPVLKISNHNAGAYAGALKFESYHGGSAYETAALYGYGGSGSSDGMLSIHTRGTERMRLDKDGNVTKPNNPSFAAYQGQSAWSVSSGATMVFNSTRHNVGGHYNTSNGRFTAPVAGNYLFTFFIIYTGNYNSAYMRMFKNGARQYGSDIHFTHADNGSHWDNIAYSQIFNLAAGDYISMINGNPGVTYHGNHWMQFCGYLLG